MSGKYDKLDSAVDLVNEAIMAKYKRLEEIAKSEEGDPIMVEGGDDGWIFLSDDG